MTNLIIFKDVLKFMVAKISEKKYWVDIEKTAKTIDFVDFEMTDRPSILNLNFSGRGVKDFKM